MQNGQWGAGRYLVGAQSGVEMFLGLSECFPLSGPLCGPRSQDFTEGGDFSSLATGSRETGENREAMLLSPADTQCSKMQCP